MKLFLLILVISIGIQMTGKEVRAPFEVQVDDYKTYSFETDDLKEFKTAGPSKISISDEAYAAKSGNSLRWEWKGKVSELIFSNPDAFKNLSGENPDDIVYDWVTCCNLSTFTIWVFNPEYREDKIWFEIGDGSKVDCRFYMNLNFTGWRKLKAMYGRDIEGFPNQKTADTLRIIAPDKPGELYFDEFAPRTEQDVRFFMPSKQTPWIKTKKKFRPDIDCDVKGRIYPDLLLPGFEKIKIAAPAKLSAKQISILESMDKKAFGKYRRPAKKKVTEKQMSVLRKKLKQHDIRYAGKGISGVVGKPRNFWGEMMRLAVAYHQSSDIKQRKELLGMYNEMLDLVLQHGHGTGYGLGPGFVFPIWLMKDELKKSGRFDKVIELEKQLNGVYRHYLKDDCGTADNFNTLQAARFLCIMLQDNTPLKWQDLNALKLWLDRSATDGIIKPDGTLQHHGMIYNGYNLPAVAPVVDLVATLKGTPFESVKMHKAIKQVTMSMAFYSSRAEASQLWGGRWRGGSSRISPAIIEKLMRCGNPGENNTFDRELAPLLMFITEKRLSDLLPNFAKAKHKRREINLRKQLKQTVAELKKDGIKPLKGIQGHLTLNHAASSVHRRGDWVFTAKGQKKGYNANEIYGAQDGANSMGRYLSYGAYQIISKGSPVNAVDSGFNIENRGSYNGWDFNFWPGTTIRELPYEALRSQFQVEEILTNEVFCGGNTLGNYGMFSMKFQEELPPWGDDRRLGPPVYWLGQKEYKKRLKDAMYDITFNWRKSLFFFDDYILALGSGISSKDTKHRVCTVLLQNHLKADSHDKFILNNKKLQYPLTATIKGESWFIDAYNNGYYIAKNNDKLEISRKHQDKPYYNKWDEKNIEQRKVLTPNAGDTELVVINHGKAPDNADYEYAILVDAGKEKTKKFAADIPYTVHQKDAVAHVVSDRNSGITAYSIFDAKAFKGFGLLKSVSRPCMVMIQGKTMTVCYPDFGEYIDYAQVGSKGTSVSLTLKNGKVVQVNCIDGIPVKLKLEKI